jgi:hypothetical protein
MESLYGIYGRIYTNTGKDGKKTYSEAESSRNVSDGEERRRLEGKVWKDNVGPNGVWNNYRSSGPC